MNIPPHRWQAVRTPRPAVHIPSKPGAAPEHRRREMTEAKELIRRLAMVLDASIPALDAAARLEKRREEGKSMRQITEQERVKTARELVSEAEAFLYPRDPDDIEDESVWDDDDED